MRTTITDAFPIETVPAQQCALEENPSLRVDATDVAIAQSASASAEAISWFQSRGDLAQYNIRLADCQTTWPDLDQEYKVLMHFQVSVNYPHSKAHVRLSQSFQIQDAASGKKLSVSVYLSCSPSCINHITFTSKEGTHTMCFFLKSRPAIVAPAHYLDKPTQEMASVVKSMFSLSNALRFSVMFDSSLACSSDDVLHLQWISRLLSYADLSPPLTNDLDLSSLYGGTGGRLLESEIDPLQICSSKALDKKPSTRKPTKRLADKPAHDSRDGSKSPKYPNKVRIADGGAIIIPSTGQEPPLHQHQSSLGTRSRSRKQRQDGLHTSQSTASVMQMVASAWSGSCTHMEQIAEQRAKDLAYNLIGDIIDNHMLDLLEGMTKNMVKGLAEDMGKAIAEGLIVGLENGLEKGLEAGLEQKEDMASAMSEGIARGMVTSMAGMGKCVTKHIKKDMIEGMANGIGNFSEEI